MVKVDHINYSLIGEVNNSLDDIVLEYVSIPTIGIEDIDISTRFCDIDFKIPFFVNAMTGGSEISDKINKRLEYICNKVGIFMFSGSYSMNLKENKYYYPKNMGINLGADKSLEDFKKAISETKAKILQIHVNPLQELMNKDGDRDFKNYERNIKDAVNYIKIPIILKETGFGMSPNTIKRAIELKIKTIDISGKGGTDFSKIEDMRACKDRRYIYSIGYTTKDCLLFAQEYLDKIEVLASGGITNPLDIVKCLSMGAKAVGMSAHILKLLDKYEDDKIIIDILNEYIYEIKMIMCITNSKNLIELKGKWSERKKIYK